MTTGSVCTLLPGAFGIGVQAFLGCVSFASLLIKYFVFERGATRKSSTFLCDVGKQVIGAMWLHCANVIMAITLDRSFTQGTTSLLTYSLDVCDWYFMSIVLDTTMGVMISVLLLQCSQHYFQYVAGRYTSVQSESGNVARAHGKTQRECYGTRNVVPDAARAFLSQLLIWILVITCMKGATTLLLYGVHSWLAMLAHLVLSSLNTRPNYKLLVVMVAVPVTMNSFQYCVVDHFLKDSCDFTEGEAYVEKVGGTLKPRQMISVPRISAETMYPELSISPPGSCTLPWSGRLQKYYYSDETSTHDDSNTYSDSSDIEYDSCSLLKRTRFT